MSRRRACRPRRFGAGAEFGLSTASYLGDAGNADAVRGARILSDGKIVLAANLGTAAPGGTVTLLNGATATTPGAIVRLNADGKTVLSVTRLAAEVRDLAVDAADNLYVAAGNDGVIKLNAAATAIVWQGAAGNYIHRVDAGPAGRCAALSTTTPSNADEAAGAGTVWSFDAGGALVASWPGKSNTMDVCLDEASQTVVTIGYRQANAYGPPGDANGFLPVQISYLKDTDYAGAQKWLAYDWAPNTGYDSATDSFVPGANDLLPAGLAQEKIDPRFLNRLDNNMADTRGLRCALGLDPSAASRPPAAVTFTDATGAHLALIFTRPNDRTGITLTGQAAGTPAGTWLSGAADVGQSVLAKGDGTETVTIWGKSPITSAAQRFLRLRVTQP